jgi:hypothetical protein
MSEKEWLTEKKLMVIVFVVTLLSFTYLSYAQYVFDQAQIDVQVANSYHSYTKAFNQRQDYLIECNGTELVNFTPLYYPIIVDAIHLENLCY